MRLLHGCGADRSAARRARRRRRGALRFDSPTCGRRQGSGRRIYATRPGVARGADGVILNAAARRMRLHDARRARAAMEAASEIVREPDGYGGEHIIEALCRPPPIRGNAGPNTWYILAAMITDYLLAAVNGRLPDGDKLPVDRAPRHHQRHGAVVHRSGREIRDGQRVARPWRRRLDAIGVIAGHQAQRGPGGHQHYYPLSNLRIRLTSRLVWLWR